MNIDKERAEFETASRKHAEEAGYDPDCVDFIRDGDGYANPARQAAWWGWKERASLQSHADDTLEALSYIKGLEDGRDAALQSQPNGGWKEAFKAWNICASIHREWAKGKDVLFTTRQADFVWHAENAFKKAFGADALKSQQPKVEFEDPRVQQVYKIICGDNHPPEGEHWDGYVSRLIVDALQSQERKTASAIRGDSYAGIYVWYGESNYSQRISKPTIESARDERAVFNFVAEGAIEALMDRVLGEAIDHARRIEGEGE